MTKPIGFTPPGFVAPEPQSDIRRRHVFFVPGYDPDARRRYRTLFVRELIRYTTRFDRPKRRVTKARTSQDGLVQSWSVEADEPGGTVATRYDVLLWDDIVARDFKRPIALSFLLITVGIVHIALTGTLTRLYRLNWKYGHVIVYPFLTTMLLLLAAAALALGLYGAGIGWLGLPRWAAALGAGLVALAGLRAVAPLMDRVFLWQILNDWVFNWQHGNGWRADYAGRLDAFADHVRAVLRESDAEEVLFVGHSTGALTATELAARVLADRGLAREGAPSFGLVTLGSGLPLVAMQPRARRVRADVASLVTRTHLVWVDYQAPQDWMNFPGFNPVSDLPLGVEWAAFHNPLVRSAKFKEVRSPANYEKIRWSPFKLHFQFLMANDRPGDYDVFALTLGPQRLADRVLAPRVVPLRAGAADPAGLPQV